MKSSRESMNEIRHKKFELEHKNLVNDLEFLRTLPKEVWVCI